MSTRELAAKIESLTSEQRYVVESLLEVLSTRPVEGRQRDLTNHPSFGAWAARKDLPADSDAAARDLRKRASRRESA